MPPPSKGEGSIFYAGFFFVRIFYARLHFLNHLCGDMPVSRVKTLVKTFREELLEESLGPCR